MTGRANMFFLGTAGAILLATLLLAAMVGPYSQDPDYFTYIGRSLAAGRRLYVDVWDCKGPVVYWFSAIGAFIFPVMGQQIVFAAVWLAAFAMVYRLAGTFCGRHAGFAVFLFAFMALGVNRFGTVGRQEALAALFVATAVALGTSRRTLMRCFAVGACAGTVFMIKPTLLAFVPVLVVYWFYHAAMDGRWRGFALSCAVACAGGLVVLLVITAIFLPDRVDDLWRGALIWNMTDRSPHSQGLFSFWTGALSKKWFLLKHGWVVPVWGACYASAGCMALTCRSRRIALLMLWATLEALAAFGYPAFCSHYVILAFLPVSLAIGCGMHECGSGRATIVPLVMIGMAFCFVAGWSVPRVANHIKTSARRSAYIEWIRKELEESGGKVVVYGANRTAAVLNAMDVLSAQKYPGIKFWHGSTTKSFRDELSEDFRRVADSGDTQMLIVEYPYKIKSVCARTEWDGQRDFEFTKDCPELEISVYRRKAAIGK